MLGEPASGYGTFSTSTRLFPTTSFSPVHIREEIRKMSKRERSPAAGGALIKRAKGDATPTNQIAISSKGDDRSKGLIRTVPRTSGLEAPIVSLAGAHTVRMNISCISSYI